MSGTHFGPQDGLDAEFLRAFGHNVRSCFLGSAKLDLFVRAKDKKVWASRCSAGVRTISGISKESILRILSIILVNIEAMSSAVKGLYLIVEDRLMISLDFLSFPNLES